MTITERVDAIVLRALKENPEGVRWADLLRIIQKEDSTIHPKTANGLIWRLIERYPGVVEKPEPGLYRLAK